MSLIDIDNTDARLVSINVRNAADWTVRTSNRFPFAFGLAVRVILMCLKPKLRGGFKPFAKIRTLKGRCLRFCPDRGRTDD
jgi:hypothetical protein